MELQGSYQIAKIGRGLEVHIARIFEKGSSYTVCNSNTRNVFLKGEMDIEKVTCFKCHQWVVNKFSEWGDLK